MKDGCLKPDEIAIAQLAPADDPRRRHLESCSRCGALAASLDLFRREKDLPDGADLEDADRRLADFLEREIVREPQKKSVPGMSLERKHRRRSSMPMVWAAAAVLAVAVGLPLFFSGDTEPPGDILLRDGSGFGPAGWSIHEPVVLADGGMRLAWDAVEGATGYDIQLLDGRQQEAGTLDAGSATELLVTDDVSGLLAGRSRPWYFRVVARDADGELMRSLPRLLPATGTSP